MFALLKVCRNLITLILQGFVMHAYKYVCCRVSSCTHISMYVYHLHEKDSVYDWFVQVIRGNSIVLIEALERIV